MYMRLQFILLHPMIHLTLLVDASSIHPSIHPYRAILQWLQTDQKVFLRTSWDLTLRLIKLAKNFSGTSNRPRRDLSCMLGEQNFPTEAWCLSNTTCQHTQGEGCMRRERDRAAGPATPAAIHQQKPNGESTPCRLFLIHPPTSLDAPAPWSL